MKDLELLLRKNALTHFILVSEYTSMSFIGPLNHPWMSKLRTNDFEAALEEVLKSDLENHDWELTQNQMTSLGIEDNRPL